MGRRRSKKNISKKKGICSDSVSNSHDHVAKNGEVISKVLLSEDLMYYILTLVPLNCLINSARYVCKPWAVTIASSLFDEMCESRARSKPGFYVENPTTKSSSYFLEFKDGVNGQFERTNLGTPQEMGDIICTRDGILLLWNFFVNDIFVVNPLLKCWLRVPSFPISRQRISRRIAQCAIARVPGTIKFKLFFVDIFYSSNAFWHVFYVLRIGIDIYNSWREIARKEDLFIHQPLFNGGNDLYWITNKEKIVMDVDKEIILREYPLPQVPSGEDPTYLWMENRLSCIVCKDPHYKTYNIHILDFDSRKWSFYHQMELFDCVTAFGHKLISFDAFRLWIDDKIIFRVTLHQNQLSKILPGIKKMHFCYNVKTKQSTKIEDIDVGDFKVWFHTNSLVSLSSTPP
jgi:hypothetical protein